MRFKLPLYAQILFGMLLGGVVGFMGVHFGFELFVKKWILPFGDIFTRLLKMIAIPLIIASLIKGVTDLRDFSSFSKMGLRTLSLYIFTTLVAISIGISLVNISGIGKDIPDAVKTELSDMYSDKASTKIIQAKEKQDDSPLKPLVDIIPDNLFKAMSSNGSMLQVIFFSIFFGIGLLLIKPSTAEPVKRLFDGVNDVILKMVDIIMMYAPIGVFALMAGFFITIQSKEVLLSLGGYMLVVVLGLLIMILVYCLLVWLIAKKDPLTFLKGIAPAQLLAFSTSSSAATLPVTMERVEEHLGVNPKVSSFVLPIGATINMDGTSLYQTVAAVFIANVFNIDLSVVDQLTIVMTALLASIGSAAVPSAGIIMLIIVLESIQVPSQGIVMILAVDRILDMCRTTVNVTGDACVSLIVASQMDEIERPSPKGWDDNFIT